MFGLKPWNIFSNRIRVSYHKICYYHWEKVRIDLETIDPDIFRDLLDEVLPDDEVGGEAFALCFDTGP